MDDFHIVRGERAIHFLNGGRLREAPPSRVASRLGRTGRELHATAHGIDPRPLIPREPPPVAMACQT